MSELGGVSPEKQQSQERPIRLDFLELAREKALTIGASPLGRHMQIYAIQQEASHAAIEQIRHGAPVERYNVDDLNWLKGYMELNHLIRFNNRLEHSYDAYTNRQVKSFGAFTSEELEIHDRAYVGAAEPAERLWLREKIGAASMELGHLLHYWGHHTDDLLTELRWDVIRAIEDSEREHILLDDPDRYKVRSPDSITPISMMYDGLSDNRTRDSLADPRGMMMTRKRNIALLDDDTLVKERLSFIVLFDRLEEVSPDLVAAIRAIDIRTHTYKQWVKRVTDIWRNLENSERLLRGNRFDIVVPLSTTIFAYNQTDDNRIKAA